MPDAIRTEQLSLAHYPDIFVFWPQKIVMMYGKKINFFNSWHIVIKRFVRSYVTSNHGQTTANLMEYQWDKNYIYMYVIANTNSYTVLLG